MRINPADYERRTRRPELRVWGRVKCRGDERTALCDYDRPDPPTLPFIARVLDVLNLRPLWVSYERSCARGWHVCIRLDRALTGGEMVALQFALRSDRAREEFNLARVICGARFEDWNLLFDRKAVG